VACGGPRHREGKGSDEIAVAVAKDDRTPACQKARRASRLGAIPFVRPSAPGRVTGAISLRRDGSP